MIDDVAILLRAILAPDEIPELLRLVSRSEAAGRLTGREADALRIHLSACYGFRGLAGPADPRARRPRPGKTERSKRGAA